MDLLSQATKCNINTKLFEDNLNSITQKIQGKTNPKQILEVLLSDTFYTSATNLIKYFNSIKAESLACLTGDEICPSVTSYDFLSESDLNNIILIVNKYEPIIKPFYDLLTKYGISMANKCGQNPKKVLQMKYILEKIGGIISTTKGSCPACPTSPNKFEPIVCPVQVNTSYYYIAIFILCLIILILGIMLATKYSK